MHYLYVCLTLLIISTQCNAMTLENVDKGERALDFEIGFTTITLNGDTINCKDKKLMDTLKNILNPLKEQYTFLEGFSEEALDNPTAAKLVLICEEKMKLLKQNFLAKLSNYISYKNIFKKEGNKEPSRALFLEALNLIENFHTLGSEAFKHCSEKSDHQLLDSTFSKTANEETLQKYATNLAISVSVSQWLEEKRSLDKH